MKHRLSSHKIKISRARKYVALSGSIVILTAICASAEDKVQTNSSLAQNAIVDGVQASPREFILAAQDGLPQRPGDVDLRQNTVMRPNADQVAENDVASVEMTNVQRVRLRATAAPEISGEYVINNGTMSIPYLGRFSVRGQHLAALEMMVGHKLSRALHRDMQVSLEIDRFQPFYIVGNVANSGEQEWRQGMTLIQAIGSSGGLAAADDTARGADASDTKLRFSLAQLERLRAERDDIANWQPSEKLLKLDRAFSTTGSWSPDEFISRQKEMLAAQRKITRTQVANLELERDVALQEMKGAERSVAAVQEQLEIARQIVKEGESMRDKRLLRNRQFMDQKVQLLTAQIKSTEVVAALEKSRANIAAISRQIEKILQDRRILVTERIEDLERIVEEVLSNKSPSSISNGRGRSVQYFVARKTAESTSTFSADLFSEILPGDVIMISEAPQSQLTETSDLGQRLATAISTTGGTSAKSKRPAKSVQAR